MSAAHVLSDATVVAKRNIIKIKRVPDLLVFTTLSPIMFVLLFSYVFGGAIDQEGGGDAYREFLMAGIFAQTVIFGATITGAGLAEDVKKAWLEDASSRSRQFLLPLARPFARLLVVLIQVLKFLMPRSWHSSRVLHAILAWSLEHFVSPTANVRSWPDSSTSESRPPWAWNWSDASVKGSPVISASSSITAAENPAGVLMPVPTAVPPSGSAATRGRQESSRCWASRTIAA